MRDRDPGDLTPDKEGASSDDLKEAILGDYIDRLNRGERLSQDLVLAAHPTIGQQLIEQLRAFQAFSDATAPESALGTLGDFTLRRQIGRGGMGVVYDAWQRSMDRQVALKVLPAGLAADDRAFSRFMREARAAGKLRHPNVAAVHAVGQDGDTPYFAMEFVEGETLAQILDRLRAARRDGRDERTTLQSISRLLRPTDRGDIASGRDADAAAPSPRLAPLQKDTAAEYYACWSRAFAGVADGLHHAHGKGIVHRDIKPSNLILDADGRVRILDFGLAHLEGQESLTASGDFLGTPFYMSPEQARVQKVRIDHRTDIYSLGATMYEMFSWQPPFQGRDYQDTLSQIMTREPKELRRLRADIPRNLEIIVLKCLEKDPEDRFRTAEALAQDLRRCARGEPIEARPQPPLERFLRRLNRHAVKLGIAFLGAIALAATALLVHQHVIGARAARAALDARLRADYHAKIARAASEIHLGEMHLAATSGQENRLDPQGLFSVYRFESVVKESPLIPVESAIEILESAEPFPAGEYEAYYHWARALELGRDADGARAMLDRLFAIKPDFVPARTLAAHLYRSGGDEPRAAEEERRAAEAAREPWENAWLDARRAEREQEWQAVAVACNRLLDALNAGGEAYHGSVLEARLRRGQARLRTGDFEGALSDFSAANFARPEAIEPYLLLARAYYRVENRGLAAAALERLHESRPPAAKDLAAVWAAVTLSQLGDLERCLSWVQRIGIRVLSRRMSAYYLLRLGRYREAEDAAREAVALDPGNGMAHLTLASALRLQGKLDEAEVTCREALRLDEDFFAPYHEMGSIQYARHDFAASIPWAQEALKRRPDHPSTLMNLGASLARLGKPADGLAYLEKSYAAGPSALCCTFMALTLEMLEPPGYIERQLDLYREAVALDPREWRGWGNLGIVLYKRFGKHEEALQKLLEAESLHGIDDFLYGHLGCVYEGLGDRANAVACYRRVAQHVRRLDRRYQNDIMEVGNTLAAGSEYPEIREEGLAILRKAAEMWPANPAVLTEFATRLGENGYYEEARSVLARVLEIEPSFAVAYLSRAAIHRRERNAQASAADVLAALRLGPGRFYAGLLDDTVELLARERSADFGGYLGQLREALEGELMKEAQDPRRVWNAWLTLSLAVERRLPGGVLEDLAVLSAAAPETCESTRACAEEIRWALAQLRERGAIRINCGGEAYTAPDGTVWHADRFFFGGRVKGGDGAGGEEMDVSGTGSDPLYRSSREFTLWDPAGRSYRIPVVPGDYRVTLHFAETESGDYRVFDVSLEGEKVLEGYDTRSLGVATADRRVYDAGETDAVLEIEFRPVRTSAFIGAIEVEAAKRRS
ncbi:MAG TPA: hypothetical protein DCM87_04640 [Planctomycetes bacterium]|nr:hypothetical protein [Planctomycetota bacterium]